MSHQAMKRLLEILEREPTLRAELERSGLESESQLASALAGIGARFGIALDREDVQALLASVRALERRLAPLGDDELERVSGGINSDDAQLANVDLQNWLQKMQQTLQMMSNITKSVYDSKTSVIRKIGG